MSFAPISQLVSSLNSDSKHMRNLRDAPQFECKQRGTLMTEANLFTYKASIDWVEFYLYTKEPTTFSVIKKLSGAKYVQRLNEFPGGSATAFSLRVHDLESWVQLEKLLAHINEHKPLSFAPWFTGLEVSLDAFSKEQNEDDLIEKTAEFYWLLQKPSSTNHRASGADRFSAEAMRNHKANLRMIRSGKSVYISSQKDDRISQRIYYKTTNNKEVLPAELHSARYELTLQFGECPFRSLEDAKAYRFEKLAQWFKFRKLKPNLNDWDRMISEAQQQLSPHGVKRRNGGGVRIYNPKSMADTNLNKIYYDKLRELTSRMNRTRVTRKMRGIRS